MSRAILLLAVVLSLCLTSFAAALHSGQMARAQPMTMMPAAHVMAAAQDVHDADAQHGTMPDCATSQHCGMDASFCGWVCAGGNVVQPLLAIADFRIPERSRLRPGDEALHKGVTPPLNERPPSAILL